MELTRNVSGKLLHCGYTTGSCAAAAAKAAALLLLTGDAPREVEIETRDGRITLCVLEAKLSDGAAACAVRKDGGDDIDATDGALICARVVGIPSGVEITGGEGVGRVTRPGLDQPVGEAAINSTPRRMIEREVGSVLKELGCAGGVSVCIYVPGGAELAKRTYNPHMGIEGGISIIGTTGIVEPMSNRALIETVRLETRQLAAQGKTDVWFTPGNYGEKFAADTLGLSPDGRVICSNFIGEALDAAAEYGFKRVLIVGHIGKLVKLGIGAMNTHSASGDGRMETLTACALEAGGGLSLLRGIMGSVTTDAALELTARDGLLEGTLSVLGKRIETCLSRHVPEGMETGYVCFTNAGEPHVLMQSGNAEELMDIWRIKA